LFVSCEISSKYFPEKGNKEKYNIRKIPQSDQNEMV